MNILSARELRRSKNLMTYTTPMGMFFASLISCGLFLSALCSYAELSNLQIGFVNSIPSIVLPAQLISASAMLYIGKRKSMFIATSILSRLLLFPLCVLVFFRSSFDSSLSSALLIVFLFGISFFNSLSAPCWFSWIGDIVPQKETAAFWGRRNAFNFVANIFISLLIGFALDWDKEGNFSIGGLLLLGAVLALSEIFFYSGIPRVEDRLTGRRKPNLFRVIKDSLSDYNFKSFIAYYSFFSFLSSFFIAFFYIYLMKELNFSTTMIQVYAVCASLAAFAGSYFWSEIAARKGNKPVIIITTLLKVLEFAGYIMLWQNAPVWFCALVFIYGGFMNAGLMTSVFAILTAETPSKNRSMFMALFFTIAGIAGFMGALASGVAMDIFSGMSVSFHGYKIAGFQFIIFFTGMLLPVCALLLLPYRAVNDASVWHIIATFLEGNPVRSFFRLVNVFSKTDFVSRLVFISRNRSSLFLPEIIGSLNDPAPPIRYGAISTLGFINHPESEKALIEKLKDEQSGLATGAAYSLGRMKSRNAVPHLTIALSSNEMSIRGGAAYALGEIGATSVIPEIRKAFAAEVNLFAAASMADALGKLSDLPSINTIYKLFSSVSKTEIKAQLACALADMFGDNGEFYEIFMRENLYESAGFETIIKQMKKYISLECFRKMLHSVDSKDFHFLIGQSLETVLSIYKGSFSDSICIGDLRIIRHAVKLLASMKRMNSKSHFVHSEEALLSIYICLKCVSLKKS